MSPDKSPHHLLEQSNKSINIPLPPQESLNELKSYIGQLDPNLKLLSANEPFISEFSKKMSLDLEQSANLSNFIFQENLERFQQILSNLSPQDFDISFDSQIGNTIYGWRVNAIFDSSGKVNHYTFIGQEITNKVGQQKKLEEDAFIDPRTKLYNQRFLEEKLPKLLENKNSITAIMFDADNFKEINTKYGHPEGDKILRKIAHTISDNLTSTDFVIRYGGDEFLAILPDTDNIDIVSQILFRLYNIFQAQQLQVSFGFATIAKDDFNPNLNLSSVIKLADNDLNEKKQYKELNKPTTN